jgi:hypothetical protein
MQRSIQVRVIFTLIYNYTNRSLYCIRKMDILNFMLNYDDLTLRSR